jgi:ATP synthase protein I
LHPQVRWILSCQVALATFLGLIAWGTAGGGAAISMWLGGAIGVIANAGYVWRAMRMAPGNDPLKVYRAQAAGEALKFALTILLFALVFMKYREVAALPLFLGYASTFVIYWVALLKQR